MQTSPSTLQKRWLAFCLWATHVLSASYFCQTKPHHHLNVCLKSQVPESCQCHIFSCFNCPQNMSDGISCQIIVKFSGEACPGIPKSSRPLEAQYLMQALTTLHF